MKTGWKKFGVLLLATFFVGPVQAVPITLEDLLGGDSITVGDKLFSGWELLWSDASDVALDPDPGSIMVSGLADGGLDPGPGLHFDFGDVFTYMGDDFYAYADLMFGFFVDVLDPDLQVKDVSMTTSGSISTSGAINNVSWAVIEDVYDDTTLGYFDSLYANLDSLDGDISSAVNAGSADFAGQDSIWVELNILTFAEQLTDRVNLQTMDLRFSQEQEAVSVPEPGTLALLGLGLLGMAASRRRRKI